MEREVPSKHGLRKRKSQSSCDSCQPEHSNNTKVNGKHLQQENLATATDTEQKDTSYRTSGRRRKSCFVDGNQICPVCGLTIRPSELEQHFQDEVQQIDHIVKRGRILKDAQATYAASKVRKNENVHGKRPAKRSRRRKRSRKRESDSEDTEESSSDSDCEVDPRLMLLDIRANRHARERKKELQENPVLNPETMLCPICFQPLTGSDVDRNRHVETCLSKPSTSQANAGSESSVDVDGERGTQLKAEEGEEEEGEEESYETYEWMGETRIRACSLVPGGYQGLGFPTISSRVKLEVKEEEEDVDLDVDGDETQEFGPQQYHEEDVVGRCPSSSSQDTLDVGYEDHVSDRLLIEGIGDGASNRVKQETKTNGETENTCVKHVGLPSSGIQMVVESLKARVRELEERSGDARGRLKCQICMADYNTPLVSVQCWHVHCEECWLTTLASKKLCPQCQMITSTLQLRRIYL